MFFFRRSYLPEIDETALIDKADRVARSVVSEHQCAVAEKYCDRVAAVAKNQNTHFIVSDLIGFVRSRCREFRAEFIDG